VEDGRTPQTLRVTIRRFVEGVRYSNRESRQSPVPPSVLAGLTKGTMIADWCSGYCEAFRQTNRLCVYMYISQYMKFNTRNKTSIGEN